MSDYWAEPGNQTQESAAQDVGADNMPGGWPGSWKPEWETQILEMIKLITWSVEWDNDPEIWNLPEMVSYWSEDPGGNTRACHWTTWVTRQCTLLTQTRGMIRGTRSVRTDQGSSQHQDKKDETKLRRMDKPTVTSEYYYCGWLCVYDFTPSLMTVDETAPMVKR